MWLWPVPLRRLVLGCLVSSVVWAFFTDHDIECKPMVVGTSVQQVCGPVGIDSPRVIAISALILFFVSFELAEIEFAGIKLKRLERVEVKVDKVEEHASAMQTTLNQTLATIASSSSTASGAATAAVHVALGSLEAFRDIQVPDSEVPDNAEAISSVLIGALTGWASLLPREWGCDGFLVAMAPDPVRGLTIVSWAGDRSLVTACQGRLTGPSGLAVAAWGNPNPTVSILHAHELEGITSDAATVLTLPALSPRGEVVALLVAARRGADEPSAEALSAELDGAAAGWALMAPMLGTAPPLRGADGQRQGESAQ